MKQNAANLMMKFDENWKKIVKKLFTFMPSEQKFPTSYFEVYT